MINIRRLSNYVVPPLVPPEHPWGGGRAPPTRTRNRWKLPQWQNPLFSLKTHPLSLQCKVMHALVSNALSRVPESCFRRPCQTGHTLQNSLKMHPVLVPNSNQKQINQSGTLVTHELQKYYCSFSFLFLI